MEFYAAKSLHYKVDGPYGNKNQLDKNIISIPSIFYGTELNQELSPKIQFYW